jgi:cytochrome c553
MEKNRRRNTMQSRQFTALLFALVLTIGPVQAAEKESTITLTLPPTSLGQWYKPANKRQVWLHTMFRLRRGMQAVTEYTALGDRERLIKWAGNLAKDYRSIAEMVPEWKDELELEWADRLVSAAEKMDVETIASAQRKLFTSCRGCHSEYRALAAALYRAPDFSSVVVEDQETLEERNYGDTMEGLSTSINRIVIALADERIEAAQTAREQLTNRLNNLAGSCASCHQDDSALQLILGETTQNDLEQLGKLIDSGKIKDSQKLTGHIAVNICARCHGSHRTLSDLRGFIRKESEGIDMHSEHEH